MKQLWKMLVLVLFLNPTTLWADSDGYFCAGPGYLAYEFSFSKQMPHTLFVVHFDSQIGILTPKTVRIDDYQIHGMNCGRGILELRGFDKSHFFNVTDRDKQPVALSKPPQHLDTTDSVSGNLGHWSKAGVIDLGPQGENGAFQLVITKAEKSVSGGGIEHFTFSALVQRTKRREILHRLLIFNGIFLETID